MKRAFAFTAGGALAALALVGAYRLIRFLYEDPDPQT